MDRHFKGNRIFFGRYTGNTPVTGFRRHPGLDPLFTLPDDHEVVFPGHPKVSDTGAVRIRVLRDDELRRRNTANQKLFEFVVDAERTQREARLHSLEVTARSHMARLMKNVDRPMSVTQFMALAGESGTFERDA
jgi:hypothetical protein